MKGVFNEINTRELELYTINNGDLYRSYTQGILNSLRKKAKKGEYDSEKALKCYKRLSDIGAKHYASDFGTSAHDWNILFSVADRKEVAKRLEEYYKDEILEYEEGDTNNEKDK